MYWSSDQPNLLLLLRIRSIQATNDSPLRILVFLRSVSAVRCGRAFAHLRGILRFKVFFFFFFFFRFFFLFFFFQMSPSVCEEVEVSEEELLEDSEVVAPLRFPFGRRGRSRSDLRPDPVARFPPRREDGCRPPSSRLLVQAGSSASSSSFR